MLIICAWCQKVKKSDDDPGEVSHGICQSCSEKVLADLNIVRKEPPRQLMRNAAWLRKRKEAYQRTQEARL